MSEPRFVINDGSVDLISIADVPQSAEYGFLIIDALRKGHCVLHIRPDQTIVTPPKPKVIAEPARKVHRRRRKALAAKPDPKPDSKPASDTQQIINGNEITLTVGEPVFIAWSTITAAERDAFNEMREAMGIVIEIKRGRGIRRSVGVKWDVKDAVEWHHPDDLSDTCEYCVEAHPQHAEDSLATNPS